MPKRKRPRYGLEELDPAQEIEYKKVEVEKKLVHGKKLLNRALKTARSFERQKLSKRIKLLKDGQGEAEAERLRRELESLKTLDFSVAVELHLYKTLLKSKDIQDSGLLPSYVKSGIKWKESPPEILSAIANVTARLYNTKPVKETMSQIMGSIYTALGIQIPAKTAKKEIAESSEQDNGAEIPDLSAQSALEGDRSGQSDKPIGMCEAPARPTVLDIDPESEVDSDSDLNLRLHSELLSDDVYESDNAYESRVVGSSDEESTEYVSGEYKNAHASPEFKLIDRNTTISSSSKHSQSPSPPPRRKRIAKETQQKSSTKGSTFLPTLMGGYWSGSESATDVDETSTQRKNRPGQQARRARWERKYGKSANHLKGQESRKIQDSDWDPKRGARSAEDNRFRQARGGKPSVMKTRREVPGQNAIAVASGARGMGRKDDTGPLHPSWEAAKKAKEAKQTTTFLGKKVVFE